MKPGMQVGSVLRGELALPPKRGTPQFLVRVRCGQTAGWIKMPLGMEVCLGTDDFALDGDPAPPQRKKGSTAHNFSAHVYCGQMARRI